MTYLVEEEDELYALKRGMIGHKISAIHVSGGGSQHVLTLDNGEKITVTGFGDCCARTSLYDITGLDKMIGPVVDIELDKYVRDGTSDDYYCTDLLGYKIITDHPEFGEVTTVFAGRSVHNGYYSGWFEFVLGEPRRQLKCDIEVPLDSEVWCIE